MANREIRAVDLCILTGRCLDVLVKEMKVAELT